MKNKTDSFIIKIEKKSDNASISNTTIDDIFNECSQMTYSQLPLSLWLKLYSKLYKLTLTQLLDIKAHYNNKLHAHEQEILSNSSLNENEKKTQLILLNETNLIIARVIIQILRKKHKK